MRILPIVLLFVIMLGCNRQKNTEDKQEDYFWAVQFANGVMHRSDSLIYYLRESPKYEYDYAFLGYAINKLAFIDQKYADYNKAYIDFFVRNDGSIDGHKLSDYNIDRVRPGVNMLELYQRTGEEKYKLAIETLVEQMEGQPRTNAGGFWHKNVYPYQMWLDGLYMASPFLANFAQDFDQPLWFDEVTFQLQEAYKRTLDPNTGLLYHAWDESKQQRWCNPENGQSKHFWSRATGWYMMALVDVLDYLPKDYVERASLISILQQLSEAILAVQDEETGLWYQVLDQGKREGNYLEASGSAMFIYSFAKGVKKGYLDEEFLKIASNSFDDLIKNLVEMGEDGYPILKNTCGACGLGGNPYREADYNYYVSERKIDNDQKGIAPVILAAIELNK